MNFKTLPPGYRCAVILDFTRNRKQIMAVLKLSLALLFAPLALGLAIHPPRPSWRGFLEGWPVWLATLGMLLIYLPLHELTHGIPMYALSGVRPNYGLRLPYAWCGSPVWFDRRSHVITALAPLVVWSVILHLLIVVLHDKWFWPLYAVQLSNLSGSAGDIYCAWVILRMEGELLIQDTGTRMRVMRRAAPANSPTRTD